MFDNLKHLIYNELINLKGAYKMGLFDNTTNTDGNLSFLNDYMNGLDNSDNELSEWEQEQKELQEQAKAFINGFLSDVKELGNKVEYEPIAEQCADWLELQPTETDNLTIYFDTIQELDDFLKNINNPNNYISYAGYDKWGYKIQVER